MTIEQFAQTGLPVAISIATVLWTQIRAASKAQVRAQREDVDKMEVINRRESAAHTAEMSALRQQISLCEERYDGLKEERDAMRLELRDCHRQRNESSQAILELSRQVSELRNGGLK